MVPVVQNLSKQH